MKIHEYQAKDLLRAYGVPTPEGFVAETAEEVQRAAERLGGGRVVVKAQVHAGGRGKGGGIKVADGPAAAFDVANGILGMLLKTHQDPAGRLVRRVWVERAAEVERELYLSVVLDRAAGCLCCIGCTEGGVEIEEIAARDREARAKDPKAKERLVRVHVPDRLGWSEYVGRKLAARMGYQGDEALELADVVGKLVVLFRREDASMVEVNPLVQLKDGHFMALDAKVGLEDNAEFRHEPHKKLRDLAEEEPLEAEAGEAGLNYVKLDGTIGCMVNGAGLAMATMDIIKFEGGQPANFLDVGGGASAESVAVAFRLIQRDPNVRAVLINIFGGIVRCDLVARGILDAAKQVDLKMPLVVRLKGTNAVEAMELLRKSGMDLKTAEDLAEAARLAVAAAGGR